MNTAGRGLNFQVAGRLRTGCGLLRLVAFFAIFCLGLIFTLPANARVMVWTDDNGVKHYTTNPYDIPEKFRNQIEFKKGSGEISDFGQYGDSGTNMNKPADTPAPATDETQPADETAAKPAEDNQQAEEPKQSSGKVKDDVPVKKELVFSSNPSVTSGPEGETIISGEIANNSASVAYGCEAVFNITLKDDGGTKTVRQTITGPSQAGRKGFMGPRETVNVEIKAPVQIDQVDTVDYKIYGTFR